MPAPLGPEAREKIIVALRAGATRSGAAAASGVSRRVLYDWLKDEEFAEACDQAEGWAETMAQANVRRAGDKDWKASAWWLEHHPRTKQAWRTIFKSEAEISGPGGGPIQTAGIMFQPDRAFLAAYAAALAELPDEISGPMGFAPELEAGGEPLGLPDGLDLDVLEPIAVCTPHTREVAGVLAEPAGSAGVDVRAAAYIVPPVSEPAGQTTHEGLRDDPRGRPIRAGELR